MIEVVLASISPTIGAPITKDTVLSVDVRTDDPNVFTRVLIAIRYPGSGVVELAYAQDPASGNAQQFEDFYNGVSTVTSVTDPGFARFQFKLLRKAEQGQTVWPDSPQLMIYGFNDAGEEI